MQSPSYYFYGQTTSLCEDCLQLVPTKIIFENGSVYYLKYCTTHKHHKTLISTDIEYYKQSRNTYSPSFPPAKCHNKIEKNCPFDCGLCEDHEQHTAMGIIEILDECNLHCPTCIAGSHPGAGKIRTVEEVDRMLNTLVASEGEPDIVMISGGEPTIHPNIIEILRLAKTKPIKHLMLITNGVRVAEDLEFVEELKKMKENFELYLQFDSLSSKVLTNIRGQDLTEIRNKAIQNLENAGIHSTLVCVVKKGVNENEMNDVIDYALKFKFIRGVTFQPCKITGRNNSFEKESNYITLSEVRNNILNSSKLISADQFIPHPLNPENICISYLHKSTYSIKPVTNLLYDKKNPTRKLKTDFPHSEKLMSKMFFLPELDTNDVKYKDLFRITIVSFLDKFNFCTSSVKKSCIHFVTTKDEIIPIDTYYLLYSNA